MILRPFFRLTQVFILGGVLSITGCHQESQSSGTKGNASTSPLNGEVTGTVTTSESDEEDTSAKLRGFGTVNQRKSLLKSGFGFEEVGDPPAMVESPSGLKYRIIDPGMGAQVGEGGRICVNYVGRLENGETFDSLITQGKVGEIPERFGAPVVFDMPRLIAAWKEAVPMIKEGGIIEIEVPPGLGYGDRGTNKIPPNSTLFFMIKLLVAQAKTDADLMREAIKAENFLKTPSNVFYKILKQTEGKKATFTDRVTYRYSIQTIKGETLADSISENRSKTQSPINMPKGVAEGIKMIGEGGVIELLLYPQTGFGRHSQDDEVPNNQYVRMRIELDKVESNTKIRLPKKLEDLNTEERVIQDSKKQADKNDELHRAPANDSKEVPTPDKPPE